MKKMDKIKAQGILVQAMADAIQAYRERPDYNGLVLDAMQEQAARGAIFFGYRSFPGILENINIKGV